MQRLCIGLVLLLAGLDSTIVFKWISDRVVYGLVLFCILVGSIYASINDENSQNLTLAQRGFCQFTGVVLAGALAGYAINELKWNPYILCAVGIFVGMGADTVLRWGLSLWKDSTGFGDFFAKAKVIFDAFWSAFKAAQNKKDE